jgi:hypothetical protein
MSLNIVWLGAVGMPDSNFLAIGVFTGCIMIPVLPMCATIFKTIAPAQRDRRKKKKKKAEEKLKNAPVHPEPPPSNGSPFRTPPRTRRSRVEVAGTVEAVDNPATDLGASDPRPPVPPQEPRPSAGIPPSRNNWTGGQLEEVVPPRAWQRTGPRTPEELGARRPRATGETLRTAGSLVSRPEGLPPVRTAFADTGSEREDTAGVGLVIPGKKAALSKQPALRALPRPFIFMAYCSAFVMNSMAIALAVFYGTGFQGPTSTSWAWACTVSIVFEYVLVEPVWLMVTAAIQVRLHLVKTVDHELHGAKVHPRDEVDESAGEIQANERVDQLRKRVLEIEKLLQGNFITGKPGVRLKKQVQRYPPHFVIQHLHARAHTHTHSHSHAPSGSHTSTQLIHN